MNPILHHLLINFFSILSALVSKNRTVGFYSFSIMPRNDDGQSMAHIINMLMFSTLLTL